VDEVIIGAPPQITEDVLEKVYKVSVVAQADMDHGEGEEDRFKVSWICIKLSS
jgi:hypothetical protein